MSHSRRSVMDFEELGYLVERVPQAGDLDGSRIAALNSPRLAYAVLDLAKRDYLQHVCCYAYGAHLVCQHETNLIRSYE